MLQLYRSGVIVPGSYGNLRQEAVGEMEKWVIGWVLRKIQYGKMEEDEENGRGMVLGVLGELEEYRRALEAEDTGF